MRNPEKFEQMTGCRWDWPVYIPPSRVFAFNQDELKMLTRAAMLFDLQS